MKAVVLAGGRNARPLYPGYVPGYKALVPVGGTPMFTRVLEGLEPVMSEVAVVGDRHALGGLAGERRMVEPGKDFLTSLHHALSLFPEEERVLLCTADLPLLRPEMVEQFLALCQARPGGDLYLAMVPRERFQPPFDRCCKNFNPFGDGPVCHGNLALVRPQVRGNVFAMSQVNRLYEVRKTPLLAAAALGFRTSLMYGIGVKLFHVVTLQRYAERLSRRFRMRMIPILSSYPQVALDVDEAADYQLACSVAEG